MANKIVTIFGTARAKAGDEIQRTGTVTFPKQLLPGPLAESMSRKRLARPSDNPSEELDKLDQPERPSRDASGWEVVERLEDAEMYDDG